MESAAFRSKEHDERLKQAAKSEARNALPPSPQPNIKFRRLYRGQVFLGHEIGGQQHEAFLVEVGNEIIGNGVPIGQARALRAQVIYFDDKTKEELKTECPAAWKSESPEIVNIPIGEGRSFVIATIEERTTRWSSAPYSGIILKGTFDIQARILSADGQCLGDTLKFKFKWAGDYSEPVCERG